MPLRDDLLSPFPGANPSGAKLRYDPVIDAIKEARRQDLDVAQGEWKTALKTADHGQVIQLSSDLLEKRSKDLQVAVWLVDALLRSEGFSALPPGFQFLAQLLDLFWDTLYPEIEDDDVEMRAAPLEWLGNKLEEPLLLLPITAAGLSFVDYKQSRVIGYEQDATTDERKRLRQQALQEEKPTGEDFDAAVAATSREFYDSLQATLTAALQKLQALAQLCDEKFGISYSPSFVKARTALESISTQVRSFLSKKGPVPVAAPALPAAPTPAVVVPVVAPAAPASVVPAAVVPASALSAGPEPTSLEDALTRTGAICRYLREKTIYDASAFLLIRAFRWGELRAKAPAIDPVMLQAPPVDLRTQLKGYFVQSSWDAVIETTEKAMELPCGRAWLDLQRYTVQALEKKGEYYVTVAISIRNALRSLLEELPGLLDQTLSDDTPVANPETRAWINSQVIDSQVINSQVINSQVIDSRVIDDKVLSGITLSVAAPSVAPTPLAISQALVPAAPAAALELRPPDLEPDEEKALGDVFEQALLAAQSSQPEAALDLISRQLASERSGRGRFRRRTQLAHLLMLGGHKQIALPILEQLAAEIDQRHLTDWEHNEALAYPVDLLLRCLDANGAEPANRKQLYARLCQLDPVRALKSAL